MDILMLVPQPFYQSRGTPMAVDLLLRGLSNRGDRVDVVTFHEGEDVQYPNVTLHRIKAPRWARGIRPGFSLRKLFCDVLLFFLARRLAARRRYDVVHAGEESVFIAMVLKALYRVPYVYDMDSSLADQLVEKMAFLRPLRPLFRWCEARAVRGSLAVVPVCPALADIAHRRGAGCVMTLPDISQLPGGDFDTDWFLRKQLEIDGTLFLYVGNLEPYQGIDLLLESLAVARRLGANADLVIAGGRADDIDRYRRKADALGVGPFTHLIGPWPVNDLGRLLAEADVLVAPRVKGVNTPMKVFSYLHSGRPVLATDLPTHTQVLDGSIAALAPADPEGFGRAMVRLAADEELRGRLGAAGKRFVEEKHTFPQYQARLNGLYDFVGSRVGGAELPSAASGPEVGCAQ